MIAAKVANARALDWPRERLEVIVACDGSPDDTAAARARRRRRRRARPARAAARSARRTPRSTAPRGELLAFSDANALWEPGALRALVGAVRRPGGRLRLRAGALRQRRRGTNQEGLYWRYEMALRALRVRSCASVTAGNGAIYADAPRRLPARRPGHGPRPVVPVQHRQARVARGLRARRARATEKMVPTIEGEWRAQAADDEPRLADRPARRAARPARLPAALRADDRLAPRCCATPRRSCTSSRWAPTRRCSARAPSYRRAVRAPGRPARRGARRAARPRRGRCCRALLRAHARRRSPPGCADHLRHGTPAGWAPPEGTR